MWVFVKGRTVVTVINLFIRAEGSYMWQFQCLMRTSVRNSSRALVTATCDHDSVLF